MGTIQRTSKWAIWAQRMGGFALPLGVLPIWLHRSEVMSSGVFQFIISVAVILACLAILLGIAAYIRIWQTGDHGWGRATLSIFIGLLCLSPIIYGTSLAARYPLTNDVTTNWERNLSLTQKEEPPLSSLSALSDEILQAFPGATARVYSLSPQQMFGLIEELVALREWKIVGQNQPGNSGRTGQINALAMTLMGWQDEVVLRVTPSQDGTKVDMRSTSLNGAHDLGTNGLRIEGFLAELDAVAALPQKNT